MDYLSALFKKTLYINAKSINKIVIFLFIEWDDDMQGVPN